MTTASRYDISLREEVEEVLVLGMEAEGISTWVATLDGRLSTGESAWMERSGRTSDAAFGSLRDAITEQGWEIR